MKKNYLVILNCETYKEIAYFELQFQAEEKFKKLCVMLERSPTQEELETGFFCTSEKNHNVFVSLIKNDGYQQVPDKKIEFKWMMPYYSSSLKCNKYMVHVASGLSINQQTIYDNLFASPKDAMDALKENNMIDIAIAQKWDLVQITSDECYSPIDQLLISM